MWSKTKSCFLSRVSKYSRTCNILSSAILDSDIIGNSSQPIGGSSPHHPAILEEKLADAYCLIRAKDPECRAGAFARVDRGVRALHQKDGQLGDRSAA